VLDSEVTRARGIQTTTVTRGIFLLVMKTQSDSISSPDIIILHWRIDSRRVLGDNAAVKEPNELDPIVSLPLHRGGCEEGLR
jgi:hypothetical protein